MSARRHARSGFTLAEIVVSTVILAIGLAAAVSGLLYVTRGERLNSVQNELDMDVRKAMERVRADLRLSAADQIFYWPPGPGPYTAMSFPMARDDDGNGLVELDANGKIIWDYRVCYHVWPVTPNQLRRTVFDPQTNRMFSDVELQQQLNDVVAYGNGAYTYNAPNARTVPVFENLFTWRIHAKGPQFDAYTPQLTLMRNVNYGSILLTPGPHVFRFTVVGKNALSTGHKIGLDTLTMSPCGLEREGEVQTVSAQLGATASAQYMAGGSWSANYHLNFPAAAVSNYVELAMENDRWEETNFRGAGALCENTEVVFDQTLSPMDFVLRIPPQTSNWEAVWQTLDPEPPRSTSANFLKGCAIRVLIRGAQQPDGGGIRYEGPLQSVRFWAAQFESMRVLAAYFAEAASFTNYTPDINTNTLVPLYFNRGNTKDARLVANSETDAWVQVGFPLPYITRDKSYVVSFLVDDVNPWSDARYVSEQRTGVGGSPPPPGCYIIPRSASPTEGTLRAAVWSTNTALEVSTNLYGVRWVRNYAPPIGTFESQVVDTKIDAPTYLDINWNAIRPAGTQVRLRVRTDDTETMSGATAWSNITALSSPGALTVPSKRYAQFQVEMRSTNNTVIGVSQVPSLRDVTIRWTGAPRMVDLAGTITTGPDYGVHELTVDGKKPVKGMTIDLTIYEDVTGFRGQGRRRLTSTLTAEIEPRNTGK